MNIAKYLFLLYFFNISLLFLLLTPASSSAESRTTFYKNRRYVLTGTPRVLCDERGMDKLITLRKRQIEETGTIRFSYPFPSKEEGCIQIRGIDMVIIEPAKKYSLPLGAYQMEDPDGEYPCLLNPEKSCRKEFFGPLMQYLEVEYLHANGNWYKSVFIEVDGDFEMKVHPDDLLQVEEKEGRTPDALSGRNKLAENAFTFLIDAFSSSLNKANNGYTPRDGFLSILQDNYNGKKHPSPREEEENNKAIMDEKGS